MELTIEGGADRIIADLGELPEKASRAMVRALNRSVGSGQTLMVRLISEDTGLRAKDVRDAIRLQEATLANPEASIRASAKILRLIKFQARQTRKGVTYNMGPGGGGRKLLEHAFIATVRGGSASENTGVFLRKGKARLPIAQRFGVSIGHVFAKHRPAGVAKVMEVFDKNFDHELDFATSDQFAGARAAVGLDE